MITTITATTHYTLSNSILRPLSKQLQWDLINSKLDTMYTAAPLLTAPRWLDVIDTTVLLLFLAKIRSEAEFRQPRTERPDMIRCKSEGVKSSAHVTRPCSPENVLPEQTCSMRTRAPARRSLSNRATELCRTGFFEESSTNTSAGQHPESEKLSPFSPTFGPRKGQVPAGTLKRRRIAPPKNHLTDLHNASHSASRDSPCFITTEKRHPNQSLMWQAAWLEIERNVDFYAEKLRPGPRERIPSKQELWSDIIALIRERSAPVDRYA